MDNKENVDIVKDELTGDILLSGHEYDGIQELDNALPKWWVWLFYFTILFSVGYFLQLYVFHTMDNQDVEYQKEVAAAIERIQNNKPVALDENTMALLTDEASLAEGKTIFNQFCLSCHMATGGGGPIGPNLTDQYWIHGGSFDDVAEVIKTGVAGTSMVPWGSMLTPVKIQQVSSFILSLQGSNPPDGIAPQGELYIPE